MNRFRNISIKRKLVMIIMTGGSVALLLASAAFVMEEWTMFRQTTVQELTTLADIIGYNCAASLTLNVPKDAEDILRSLATEPHINAACIYNTAGAIHAKWIRPGQEAAIPDAPLAKTQHRFERDYLWLLREISFNGEKTGTVFLRSDLTAMKSRLTGYAGIVAVVLIASSLVTWWVSARLQRVISEPIFHLLKTADAVARDQNYAIRAESQGNDELGLLVKGFNNMLAQIQIRGAALQEAQDNLERTVDERTQELKLEIAERKEAEEKLTALHSRLLEASRQAGMAEVATGVLHNVGNVLNSVNVSAQLLQDLLRNSSIARVNKLAAVLREHENDLAAFLTHDARGCLIPSFLTMLSEQLNGEAGSMRREVKLLAENIEHIKNIVALQQSYASASGVLESLPVTELVEDALRMYVGGFHRKGITVVRQYDQTAVVTVDKHRSLQILMNLVSNAEDSLLESGHSDMSIRIQTQLDQNRRVRIAVADNGLGIQPENLTRIFSQGYTTKKGGHGFGLHYGALAAKELGGTLTAHSAGLGLGATFTLELPLESSSS